MGGEHQAKLSVAAKAGSSFVDVDCDLSPHPIPPSSSSCRKSSPTGKPDPPIELPVVNEEAIEEIRSKRAQKLNNRRRHPIAITRNL